MNDRFKFRVPVFDEGKFLCFHFFNAIDVADHYREIGPYAHGKEEQCTGLKDKNKRLIYEGDIVRSPLDEHDGEFGKITWDDIDACWGINYSDVRIDFGYVWADKFEVIGNIHENPELLEVKK